MTKTFRSTAPDRKQAAVVKRARAAGFVSGYAAGLESGLAEDALPMPSDVIVAFWAMHEAMTTRAKASDDYLESVMNKAQAATALYETLKAHMIPEGEVSP